MSLTSIPEWSGPGILQAFMTLAPSSALTQKTLEKWLDEIYVPALVNTGTVKSAWRYDAANPNNDKPLMLIYKVPNLRDVQAGKLQEVRRTSELFPTDEPLEAFIVSDLRILQFEQLYEMEKQPEGASSHDPSFIYCFQTYSLDEVDTFC